MRLLGDGQALPSQVRSLVVQETDPVEVDRDEVLLIEDFRLKPDGRLLAPGHRSEGRRRAVPDQRQADRSTSPARANERLRLRLINGCQRNAIALKFDDHDVRVMAIDGQPAEPFPARNDQVVLAPGTRIDVFIDAVRPAGSTSTILLHDGKDSPPDRPALTRPTTRRCATRRCRPPRRCRPTACRAQLDLKSALRVDLALSAASPDWIKPARSGRQQRRRPSGPSPVAPWCWR